MNFRQFDHRTQHVTNLLHGNTLCLCLIFIPWFLAPENKMSFLMVLANDEDTR